jgi:hypothetical protein
LGYLAGDGLGPVAPFAGVLAFEQVGIADVAVGDVTAPAVAGCLVPLVQDAAASVGSGERALPGFPLRGHGGSAHCAPAFALAGWSVLDPGRVEVIMQDAVSLAHSSTRLYTVLSAQLTGALPAAAVSKASIIVHPARRACCQGRPRCGPHRNVSPA